MSLFPNTPRGYGPHVTGNVTPPPFDGETYVPERDGGRLSAQLVKVYGVMADGKWRTAAELEAAVGANWASVSARLRDLRKEKFGGYVVERRNVGGGVFEYRLNMETKR